MTTPNDDRELCELPPSEQPPTDDPWVIVTPMPAATKPLDASPETSPRRARALCAVCGAYWPCEHNR